MLSDKGLNFFGVDTKTLEMYKPIIISLDVIFKGVIRNCNLMESFDYLLKKSEQLKKQGKFEESLKQFDKYSQMKRSINTKHFWFQKIEKETKI